MNYPQFISPSTEEEVLRGAFKSSFSDSAQCVVVGLCSTCPDVHFYDSKRNRDINGRTPIFTIEAAKWAALVAAAQDEHRHTGRLSSFKPTDWFCSIVSRFTAAEIEAFKRGVVAGEFTLDRLAIRLEELQLAA